MESKYLENLIPLPERLTKLTRNNSFSKGSWDFLREKEFVLTREKKCAEIFETQKTEEELQNPSNWIEEIFKMFKRVWKSFWTKKVSKKGENESIKERGILVNVTLNQKNLTEVNITTESVGQTGIPPSTIPPPKTLVSIKEVFNIL